MKHDPPKRPTAPSIPPLDLQGALRRFRENLGIGSTTCYLVGFGGCDGEVKLEMSRTAFPWDPKSGTPDPNAPVALCRVHAKEHHDYWDEMHAQADPRL